MKIIVDTDKYSGNFEREMCAYATGQVGECGVGDNIAAEELPNIVHADWWEDNVRQQYDGCARPVGIYPTPGFINDGMGGHYSDTPENRAISAQAAVDKLIAYHAGQKKMCEDRIANNDFEDSNGGRGWDKDGCERTLRHIDAHVNSVQNTPSVHPAYQSIMIEVRKTPPDVVFEEFTRRVNEYATANEIAILAIRKE